MNEIENLREIADMWKLFGEIPDEATIPSELAAVFLGVSDKTLSRLRQKGGGPPYFQANEIETKARNQRVNYILGDLRVWRESKKVANTVEAAQVRGMTFATMSDVLEEMPFWRITTTSSAKAGLSSDRGSKSRSLIEGHVLGVPDSRTLELLNDERADVVWLSLVDAMSEPWADGEARLLFHRAYVDVLQGAIYQSEQQQEAAELRTL